MAKRVKLGTTILVGVLSAIVVGGAVGIIASASNGFDKDILGEWTSQKEDYVKINLQNKYNGKVLDTSSALEFLNYGNDTFELVNVVTSVTLDNGAMIVADGGALKVTFADDMTYNRIKVTAAANYTEVLEDEDGKEHVDIFGNTIVQEIISSDSTLTLEGLDPVTFKAGKDEKSYPKSSSKTFAYEEGTSELSISVTDGDLRITSIELWNIAEDTEEVEE